MPPGPKFTTAVMPIVKVCSCPLRLHIAGATRHSRVCATHRIRIVLIHVGLAAAPDRNRNDREVRVFQEGIGHIAGAVGA